MPIAPTRKPDAVVVIDPSHLSVRTLDPGWGQLAERWELRSGDARRFTINPFSTYAPGALVHATDCRCLKGWGERDGSGYLGNYDESAIEALFALDDHARRLGISLVGWCQQCTVRRVATLTEGER